ncbi:hypothetical protein [Vannielia litorea]|uniref:Uncharacterized protein n=1 Tax=Vannielia litorea TaxID=1217970 RepID=A0A1N6GF29_9RHOB|nr:hypothetical protein [Vannielia litorea]SIO06094.1 hypothetical protein SAMN05444002_2432 [Vannielia litorea]
MKFLSLAIILVFGFGTAGLVAQVFEPHWLVIVLAYSLGTLLGLLVIWAAYIIPPTGSRASRIEGGGEPAKRNS